MKETIAGTSLFLVIITLAIITNTTTDRITDELTEYCHGCETDILSGNWDAANIKIKEARENFVKNSHTLESYLIHEDIERLSDILTNIEIAVELKDKNESFSNIKIFLRRLRELSESDKLSFNNIL